MTIDQAVSGTRSQAPVRHYPFAAQIRFDLQGSASKPATPIFAPKNGSGNKGGRRDREWLKRGPRSHSGGFRPEAVTGERSSQQMFCDRRAGERDEGASGRSPVGQAREEYSNLINKINGEG